MSRSTDPWPIIAIAVPFWSDLGRLRELLDSLVAQDDLEWRAVVVDDASPEPGADALVAGYGDIRLSAVRNATNLGVAGNFERCFRLAADGAGGATADVAVIVHADDLLEPGFVAAVRRAHRRDPQASCAVPRARVVDGRGEPVLPLGDRVKRALWPRHVDVLRGGDGLRRLLVGQFFYCPAVSYRVAAMPELLFDPRWKQVMDLDLYGRILLGGGSILLEDSVQYVYRRHDESATEVNSRTMLRSREEATVCRELTAAAGELGWRRAALAGHLRPTVRANALLRSAAAAWRRA
jgi:glycosyltransferase involved in cell wall biosynthesis